MITQLQCKCSPLGGSLVEPEVPGHHRFYEIKMLDQFAVEVQRNIHVKKFMRDDRYDGGTVRRGECVLLEDIFRTVGMLPCTGAEFSKIEQKRVPVDGESLGEVGLRLEQAVQ